MKKPVIFLIAALLLITGVIFITACQKGTSGASKSKSAKNPIVGTWLLESYKYGSAESSFTQVTAKEPRIKLITEKKFLWVTYDTTTKKILKSAGGAYSLDGDNYVESIDFGYNMDSYLKLNSKFKIRVDGKMLYLTGELGDGYKIEEIWQKTDPGKNSNNNLTGTWLMETYKYGKDASAFIIVPPGRPHVQLITEDQFLWAIYDTTSKKIVESAGGKYKVDGKNFVVYVDYGYRMDDYLGIKSNYKVQVEKGMYFLTGDLVKDYKIEEIWNRAK
jgi:hypothetical protein